jgi:hypothetical protein
MTSTMVSPKDPDPQRSRAVLDTDLSRVIQAFIGALPPGVSSIAGARGVERKEKPLMVR